MTLRQARVDIGQGRGNALSNAIDYVLAMYAHVEVDTEEKLNEEIIQRIFDTADKFFHFNQVRIDRDYESWLALNDQKIKIAVGLEIPTIQNGENPEVPIVQEG